MPLPLLPARRRRARRRVPWPVPAVLALVAGALAAGAVSRAEDAARAWGERRSVPVATADLAPGHRVGPADVAWDDRPVALLPGPVADPPAGRVVTRPVLAGEPLVEARLAPAGRTGAHALAPEGARLVAVAPGAPLPPLALGDRVDLLAADPAGPMGGGGGRWVARHAVVVGLDGGGPEVVVTVAVTAEEAARAGSAALDGALAVVAVPGG